MRWVRQASFDAFRVLLVLAAVTAASFAVPMKVGIPGPTRARVVAMPEGMQVECHVVWHDQRLHAKGFQEKLVFDAPGSQELPDFGIPTSAGMAGYRAFLMRRGRWFGCPHCSGPRVAFFVKPVDPYTPPAGKKWFRTEKTVGDEVQFTLALMPDEDTYAEERPFAMGDRPALIEECRALARMDATSHVAPSLFGPELQRLNPVRVEAWQDYVVIYMGGKVHYSINPRGKNPHGPGRGEISRWVKESAYGEQLTGNL